MKENNNKKEPKRDYNEKLKTNLTFDELLKGMLGKPKKKNNKKEKK